MSLGKLRPVLYAGRCRVELPALDRAFAGRDAVAFLAHYRSAELDVRICPAGIGGAPISARVSMLNIEHYFARGEDGASLEIPDVEDLHVVMFTAYYSHQELEVSIRRARMPNCRDSARVSLEGLPEFFRWCSRATQIYFDGGKMCGFDADELAVLCGVRPGSIGVQLNAFDGLELAGVDIRECRFEPLIAALDGMPPGLFGYHPRVTERYYYRTWPPGVAVAAAGVGSIGVGVYLRRRRRRCGGR